MNILNNLLPENNWKQYAKEKENKLCLFSIMRKQNPRPTGEALRLFNAMGKSSFSSYPKKCITDTLKFKHLQQLFLNNEIKKDMFIEFLDVLELPETVNVSEIINNKLMGELEW